MVAPLPVCSMKRVPSCTARQDLSSNSEIQPPPPPTTITFGIIKPTNRYCKYLRYLTGTSLLILYYQYHTGLKWPKAVNQDVRRRNPEVKAYICWPVNKKSRSNLVSQLSRSLSFHEITRIGWSFLVTRIRSKILIFLHVSCTWCPDVPEPGLVDNDDVLQVDEEKLALLVHSKVAGGPVYNSRKLVQTLPVSRFVDIIPVHDKKRTDNTALAFLKDIKCILAAHSV